jgi:hypothetical protein
LGIELFPNIPKIKEYINKTYSAQKEIKLLHNLQLPEDIGHEKHNACRKGS